MLRYPQLLNFEALSFFRFKMTNDNLASADVLSAALAKIEMIVGNTTFPDSPTIRR